ncbi:MAG: acylphosphatase [Coprococcus sp.]
MNSSEQNMTRKHIVFSGYVQGVGFRYRAYHAAQLLGLTGWVRNEWDGTVEMEVQGAPASINKMIVMINQGTYVMIENVDMKEMPVDVDERSFRIR